MKKLIAVVVAFVLVYVAAAYATGYLGERGVRQQLASDSEFLAGQQIGIELTDYRRGVMSSAITTVIRYRDVLPDGELVVTVDARVTHGPLYWSGGMPRLGLSGIDGEFRLSAPEHPEFEALLARLWGDNLGSFTGHTGFTGRYTVDWQVPGFDQPVDLEAGRLSFAGAEGRLSGVVNEYRYRGEARLGSLAVEDGERGERIEVESLSTTFDLEYLNPYISVGELTLEAPRVAWHQLSGSTGELAELVMRVDTEAVEDKLDSQLAIDIARLDGVMYPVEDIYYRFAVKGVSQAGLSQWQANASGWDETASEEELVEALDALLQPGLRFTADMGASLVGGQSRLTFETDYVGFEDGRTLAQLDSYGDLLAAINIELVFRADEAIVMNTPLILLAADYIGTYLIDEGGEYVLRANLEDGRLTIADIPFPIEFLLMGLM